MRPNRLAAVFLALLLATTGACRGSTAPDPLVGTWLATTFRVTSAGQGEKDVLAAGGTLGLNIAKPDSTFLARTDITAAPVASSILHEGMHARVNAMGVSPVDRDMAHEERICRRAELAFGQALPPELGRPVIERAEASLLLADNDVAPEIDWAEAQRRQAEVDRRDLA